MKTRTCKLIVELVPDALVISPSELEIVTNGCLETLRQLGDLGRLITGFEVKWSNFRTYAFPGPVITVRHKRDDGVETSYTTDFRFMGPRGASSGKSAGGPHPTVSDIVDLLTGDMDLSLVRFLRDQVRPAGDHTTEVA